MAWENGCHGSKYIHMLDILAIRCHLSYTLTTKVYFIALLKSSKKEVFQLTKKYVWKLCFVALEMQVSWNLYHNLGLKQP